MIAVHTLQDEDEAVAEPALPAAAGAAAAAASPTARGTVGQGRGIGEAESTAPTLKLQVHTRAIMYQYK